MAGRASSGGDEGHIRDALHELSTALRWLYEWSLSDGETIGNAGWEALNRADLEIAAIRVKGDAKREAAEPPIYKVDEDLAALEAAKEGG